MEHIKTVVKRFQILTMEHNETYLHVSKMLIMEYYKILVR